MENSIEILLRSEEDQSEDLITLELLQSCFEVFEESGSVRKKRDPNKNRNSHVLGYEKLYNDYFRSQPPPIYN